MTWGFSYITSKLWKVQPATKCCQLCLVLDGSPKIPVVSGSQSEGSESLQGEVPSWWPKARWCCGFEALFLEWEGVVFAGNTRWIWKILSTSMVEVLATLPCQIHRCPGPAVWLIKDKEVSRYPPLATDHRYVMHRCIPEPSVFLTKQICCWPTQLRCHEGA